MTTTGRTRAELAAWLDRWNENGAAPSAETVADFLGIELAPEPTLPVGQRRRSPVGTEVIKTDDGTANPWRNYRGLSSPAWYTDAEVADWEVTTDAPEVPEVPEDVIEAAAVRLASDECPHDDDCDGSCMSAGDRAARILAEAGLLVGTLPEAPECDREHLPEGCVPINLSGWADDDLSVAARIVGSGEFSASLRAELARRGES